jgi:hypothetical protein
VKNILLFVLLLSLTHLFLYAQEWTEPVVINSSQSQLLSDEPDFCIDTVGQIHCVWSTRHAFNYFSIYYSKSIDDGETWSNPVNVSMNNSKWMTEPQIVSDNQGTLHMTYQDDAGSSSHNIIYKTNDGIDPVIWSEPDTLNQGYYGAYHNRLVIDHNDRLYNFWYISTGYGKMYYRYKDFGPTEWSDVIMPYDTASFYKIEVGTDNSLNISGATKSPYELKRRVIFYRYYDSFWFKPEVVSPQTNNSSSDLSLDAQLFPHIVWMQYSLGNGTGIDSSMYRYKNDDGWQPIEFIHSDIVYVSIIVDNEDNKHIVEVEKLNDMNVLTEYQQLNEQWEENFIEESNWLWDSRLLCKNDFIYLIYGREDSNNNINFMFRKKEVISTTTNSSTETPLSLRIFPNPSSRDITCSFTSAENENLDVKIFNQQGNLIRNLINIEKPAGEIKFAWDRKDSKGEFVRRGIFIISIATETSRITKKVIIH